MTTTNRYLMLVLGLAVGAGLLAMLGARPEPAEAAFPGTNGKIFFASDRTTGAGVNNPEGDLEIFSMNPDGTGIDQITSNSGYDDEPALSADGLRVAFIRCDAVCTEAPSLYTMGADGSNQRRLLEGYISDPAWSPDGRWIAYGFEDYEEEPLGFVGLGKIRPDGSGEEVIYAIEPIGRPGPYGPAWSPDGKKIAYAGFTGNRQSVTFSGDIFTINPDGSNKTNVTRDAVADSEPNWSPGGARIVFQKRNSPKGEIYKIKPDGTREARLTGDQPAPASSPAFSPDGNEITFVRLFSKDRLRDQPEIYTMNADGSGQSRITNNPADDYEPDWQRRPVAP